MHDAIPARQPASPPARLPASQPASQLTDEWAPKKGTSEIVLRYVSLCCNMFDYIANIV